MALNASRFPVCPVCYVRHTKYPERCFPKVNVYSEKLSMEVFEFLRHWNVWLVHK